MFRSILIFSIVLLLTVLSAAELPSDVLKCKKTDTECQKKSLHQTLQTHQKGYRPLNLIEIEPLTIKSLHLPKVAGSPVGIELNFKDIKMLGISKANIHKVSGVKEEGQNVLYEIECDFPQIIIDGPYSVDGQVLVLPIVGEGNSKIIFDNVDSKIKGKASLVEKDGKKYLHVDKVHLDLQPKKATFAFENLFKGDKTLGDNMNKFLNENWAEVYKELKPVIMEAMGKILIHICNGVFSKIEYSEMFLAE